MGEEIAVELSRIERAALEAVRRQIADQQRGELFTEEQDDRAQHDQTS